MEHEKIRQILREFFPSFTASPELIGEITAESLLVTIEPGAVLLNPGDPIRHIPLVVSGSLKVVRPDSDGREVLLYYIHTGESCAMTLASSLRRENSRIKAVALQTTRLLALSSSSVYKLTRQHPAWFDFVLDAYSRRFDELIDLVEEVSFTQLDERLIKYLKEKSEMLRTLSLNISHQEIAGDLGTSRVVASRLLKQLERKGLIELHRSRIKILGLV